MPHDTAYIATTFVAYVAFMLYLGWRARRRLNDIKDYLLGGRRIGRWVAALSAGASDMSGWLLLGLPGYAYLAGLEAVWIGLGLAVGTYVNWRLVAPRLRLATEQAGDALSIPSYLERRFDDRSGALRITASLLILVFFLFYTSSGLVAAGKLFEEVFGLDYLAAIALGTLVIVVYTLLGGFLAISWTDLAQGLLMAAALVAVPLMVIALQGGPADTLAALDARNPELLDPLTKAGGEPLGVLAILSLLAWGLGYFGQPHILARFMAIRSVELIPGARRIAIAWTVLGLLGATAVGVAAIGWLEPALGDRDSEKVFIVLASQLFHPVVAGLLLAAILAAIMSTADSQLLVAASALSEDLYRGWLGRGTDDRAMIRVARIAVVVIAGIAFTLASDPDSKVLDLVAYAWAGFGAAFGPVILLSLTWSGMTRAAALGGMLSGGLTVWAWKTLEGGMFELYELLPAFVVALLVSVVIGRLGPRPPAA
ncbi:MAG: sodium/proline symporter PutP [Gammaproteobacteria bacterium]|nr:sodium/proline symporter PutP [Gammaproteobacteria bacterium]